MRRKIDFFLKLIPLASGGWNFSLHAVGPGRTPGYYSPLAGYISEERAIRWARYHASLIVRDFSATIGSFRITSEEGKPADQN